MNKPKLKAAATKPRFKKRATVAAEAQEAGEEGNLYFSTPKEHLELISSGCETLNCVLGGGWPLGRIVNIVGDKSTGKTLLAIEALANFLIKYTKGRAKYCETEAAFDDEYAGALGLDMDKVERADCATVEELFDDMSKFIEDLGTDSEGLYIVDSLDALSDKAEQERGIGDSTYGASKPKQLGQLFRRLVKPLEKSKVCVIIISQVRDAIGVSFGDKHTRSGGRALDFYSSINLWLANTGQIKKTVSKINRTIGVSIKAKTKKNKVGLPFRECAFDILFGYGIDDVSSSLDFLKEAGQLELIDLGSSDQALAAFKKQFAALPFEEQVQERERIAREVREVWFEIEKKFLPKRGKYVTT